MRCRLYIFHQSNILMNIQSSKNNILYVEDNYVIQMTMSSFLTEKGFTLFIADNASQALHYIFNEKLSIDALLTDVNLGEGANGWEVARCARLRAPMMPVIYTSSVSEADWIANAVPFSRLCRKPFRPSHVSGVLVSLLGPQAEGRTGRALNLVRRSGSDSRLPDFNRQTS